MQKRKTVGDRLAVITGEAKPTAAPEAVLPFERPWGKPELAAYLGVTVSGLDKLIVVKKVPPFFRAGRMLRWRPDVARRWTEQQEQASA